MAYCLAETWPLNEDTCEANLAFCGLPPPAVSAVMNAFNYCCTAPCDCESNGTKDYTAQKPFLACWVNPMLTCCMFCVPCYSTSAAVRNLQAIDRFDGSNGSFLEHCLAYYITGSFCLAPCHYASMRSKLRKKYDIKGSRCEDCCLSVLFGPCAICQDANELQVQEKGKFRIPSCALEPAVSASKNAVAAEVP